eukprot:g5326.t1
MAMRWILLCAVLVSTGGRVMGDSELSVASFQLQLVSKLAAARDVRALRAELEAALSSLPESEALPPPALSKDAKAAKAVAVIGGGLSGFTASKRLLEQGHRVILIDKNSYMGGNSAKASSGINGALTPKQSELEIEDSVEQFYRDTMKSSDRSDDSFTASLVRRMVDDSAKAVDWIASRANVKLPDVGQLGGHALPRTHRPSGKLAGAAFISGLERAVMKERDSGRLTVLQGVRLEGMEPLPEESTGWDLRLNDTESGEQSAVAVAAVVLATGGYANDKGKGSLLAEVAPHLVNLGSTNGAFATGDGIKIGRAIGAKTVDLDMVQVHPTGFSDQPKGFKQTAAWGRSNVLCAEIMRGVGGVLLDASGHRFVDELETRKHVTAAMNKRSPPEGKSVIALSAAAAEKVQAHVKIYTGRNLLHEVDGPGGVAEFVARRLSGSATEADVAATFQGKDDAPQRAVPAELPLSGKYYVAVVQPVLHYTMGGLAVDDDGRVLSDSDGKAVPGLFAAGEIMGGVHGVNRLGGSSLLDCVVFGLASADAAMAYVDAAKDTSDSSPEVRKAVAPGVTLPSSGNGGSSGASAAASSEPKLVVQIGDFAYNMEKFKHPGGALALEHGEDLTSRFLEAHGEDWSLLKRDGVDMVDPLHVMINGKWYDFSRFAFTHPGVSITDIVKHGEDLTEAFQRAHGEKWEMLDDRADIREGQNPEKVSQKAADSKKPHKHAQYGGKGGSWREIVGRHGWYLLHSMAAKYPEHPTEADKVSMRNFFAALGQHYPCKLCRKHLQQQLRDPSLGPVRVNTRQELTTWVCELHNMVNRDIGKPEFNCDPFHLDLEYLQDCGECEWHPPKKDASGKLLDPKDDPTKKSGYHATSGPWDALLYSSEPSALIHAKDPTSITGAKDVINLANVVGTLHDWFGVFSGDVVADMKAKAATSTGIDLDDAIDTLESMLKPAVKALE